MLLARSWSAPSLALAFGYLFTRILLVSPVWFLVVHPWIRALFDFEFQTTPIYDTRQENESNSGQARDEEKYRLVDKDGIQVIWAGGQNGDSTRTEREDLAETESRFIWAETSNERESLGETDD